MVFYHPNKSLIVEDLHSRIPLRISQSHFQRTVRTAVIDDNIFKILVRLPENAFYAFREKLRHVIHRGKDAHERLKICVHSITIFIFRKMYELTSDAILLSRRQHPANSSNAESVLIGTQE